MLMPQTSSTSGRALWVLPFLRRTRPAPMRGSMRTTMWIWTTSVLSSAATAARRKTRNPLARTETLSSGARYKDT